ncbi:flavodoxin family protein [Aeromicrobium sp.]|uniref:flavodoxin family protein n=1 Tax=Aeromicrobium sp. TaxID=1871063 RepID=UPI003D6AE790
MNAHTSGPRALVVYESMFGNTERIARAVSDGLRDSGFEVTCTDVRDTELGVPVGADLLVVGAPTHAFSLSRPRTRADALRQGAAADHAEVGLREWLWQSRPDPSLNAPLAAVFDTRVSRVRRLPGAARKAARLARHRGFEPVGAPGAFLVEGTPGPLNAGETVRATHWAESIARTCLERRGLAPARTEDDART